MDTPQIGQLVSLRNRNFIVLDIDKSRKKFNTKVVLECIDNDKLGEVLEVIWDRENSNTVNVYNEDTFVNIYGSFDKPEQINALESAIKWSSASVVEDNKMLSPFHGAIEIEDYQLEPVARALRLPRVNLLIADDVGLGKTIEAGLVLEEMIARGRVHKVLIVTPASLTLQWQSEMAEKFQLDFKIIDRDYLLKLRREFGVSANPFTSYPRLIISMDYFKREQVKSLFDQSLKTKKSLKSWDMLIIDEAHNFAPSGKQHYIKDSDRTKLLKHIAPHFEHKIFLTATPHNGFTHSFTGLLELLDPLRFSRGPTINHQQLNAVMIRRLKEQISSKNFAKRVIDTIVVPKNSIDEERFSLLDEYIKSRLENSDTIQLSFALTMLKKRLLSSPLAFARSIAWHKFAIDHNKDAITDEKLLNRITQLALEDYSDDKEKEQNEEIAVIETSKTMPPLTKREKDILEKLIQISNNLKDKADEKAKKLLEFIDNKLKDNGRWNNERLIIFTEYKDTLEYLKNLLNEEERVLTLSGGDTKENREIIKREFQKSPDESSVRVLIATDAASEGLNLQHYCRYLIHYEIPWNPNKMEQRNGRIDRHGQKSDKVFIYHFLHEDSQDSKFLEVLVEKVQTMREDLGSISEIVEKNVEEAMLGKKVDSFFADERQKIIRKDLGSELKSKLQYENLLNELKISKKELGIDAKNFKNMIHQALKLYGLKGVEALDDEALSNIGGIIKKTPTTWHNAMKYLKDKDGNLKKVIFEPGIKLNDKDYEMLHLSHPITKYAISEFRKELFGFNSRLNRFSYKIVDDIDELHIKASTRMLVTGKFGHLLHEEIIDVFAKIDKFGNFLVLDQNEDLEKGEFKEIPINVLSKIRLLIEKNRPIILDELQKKVQNKEKEIELKLRSKANENAKILRKLIDERIEEVSQRLKEIKKEAYKQMSLFTYEEEQQFKEDEKWLEDRLNNLKQRREVEPDSIKEQYKIKDVKSFFFTLFLYIPSSFLGDKDV